MHASLRCTAILCLLAAAALAQEKIRSIDTEKLPKDLPIRLLGVEIGGREVKHGSFVTDNNWLKNLVLVVRNISDRNVTAFDLRLSIQPQGRMKGPVGFPLPFLATDSRSDADSSIDAVPVKQRGYLAPGETVRLAIRKHDYAKWLPLLQGEDITKAHVSSSAVHFDDRTCFNPYAKKDEPCPRILEPEMRSSVVVDIENKDESPVRLDSAWAASAPDGRVMIEWVYRNTSGKQIRSMTTGLKDNDGNKQYGNLWPMNAVIEPGMNGVGGRPEEVGGINHRLGAKVWVDHVLFADGTTWGPNLLGESVTHTGYVEGIKYALKAIKDALSVNDLEKVDRQITYRLSENQIHALTGNADIKWREGFGFGFNFTMSHLASAWIERTRLDPTDPSASSNHAAEQKKLLEAKNVATWKNPPALKKALEKLDSLMR